MDKISGTVIDVVPLTDRISSITFAATDGAPLPPWEAGAHVTFDVAGDTRSYSLIRWDGSDEAHEFYTVAVQREDAGKGGSLAMHQLVAGDPVAFTPPLNSFAVRADVPALLLAGGIGVTPMISMAAALGAAGQRFKLHYAGRSADMMAYCPALEDAFGEQVYLYEDDSESRLDLEAVVADLGDAHLYVCGPRGMLDAARALAEAAGIAPERVHFELFEAAQEQHDDTPFEIQITDGSIFTIPLGQSIIEVLEAHDVDVMYDCQRGDCGICRCDVIDGVPDHRDVVLSAAEREAGDVIQICVSRAKSARLVLDI